MTAKPGPCEDEWWNGLCWADAKHMQLARVQEVFSEHQGPIRAALTESLKEDVHVGWSAIYDGIVQPVAAPRFCWTTASPAIAPGWPGARTREALTSWDIEDVDALIDRGVDVEG